MTLSSILKKIRTRIIHICRTCLKIEEEEAKIPTLIRHVFPKPIFFTFGYNTITRWLYGKCIIKGITYKYFIDQNDDFILIIECTNEPTIYVLNLTNCKYIIYMNNETEMYKIESMPLVTNIPLDVEKLKPNMKGVIYIEPSKERVIEELEDSATLFKLRKLINELRNLVESKINMYNETYKLIDMPTRKEILYVTKSTKIPRWRIRQRIIHDEKLRRRLINLRLRNRQNQQFNY